MPLLRRVGWLPVVFFAFWLLLMIGGRSKLLRDPGLFWHTTVGEKLLHEGFFTGDPFTFTHANGRWVPHQWLGEIVMALVHRVGGFDSYVLLSSTILAGLFAWLTLRFLRTGYHPILAVVIVLLAFATSAMQFHVRPLLFTMVSMVVVAVMLTNVDAGRSSLNRLFWLVPYFVIWTNTHGGMLGGFFTVVAVIVGWIAAKLVGWPSPLQSGRDITKALGLIVVLGTTAFVNPYGWEIPRAWWIIMSGPKVPALIEEHKRLDPTEFTAWPLFAYSMVFLFVLVGLRERPRISWLIPLLWLAQSFLRVRHGPLFAFVSLVVIIDVFPRTRWATWLREKRPDWFLEGNQKLELTWLSWLPPLLLTVGVLILQGKVVRAPLVGTGWAEFDRTRWPVELLPIMKEHEPKGPPARMFNDLALGGFVIYHTPGYRVFLDDRVELFGDESIDDYVKANEPGRAAGAMIEWQRQYGTFEFALVIPGGGFDLALRKQPVHWELLGETHAAVFYRRSK
jgi:hypothetical protein